LNRKPPVLTAADELIPDLAFFIDRTVQSERGK
jgi:hypothetical protein